MPVVETSLGRIDYTDTGGGGSTVVLLPGLLQDSTMWNAVVDALCDDHRCLVPVLPARGHPRQRSQLA